MLRVGLLGYGYWGPNLARNVYRSPTCVLARIADQSVARLDAAGVEWPGIQVTTDAHDVTRAADIDAVIVATPMGTHYDLALDALTHGKHVLVEKPMTVSVEHAERLVEEAARRKLVLLVDHTFVYTPAVRWMRDYAASGELGETYYFDSVRANLGLFQRDASVLWDLAPHDLSILAAVVNRPVQSVSATGACHAGSRVPDVAYVSLDLGDGCLAHFHVSWLSPVKVRRMLLAGSRKMVVYDDTEMTEKIKVYDSGVSIFHDETGGRPRMQADYRVGNILSPALPNKEALQEEIRHFEQCIAGNETPITGGEVGLAVVRMLEAGDRSMRAGGEVVRL